MIPKRYVYPRAYQYVPRSYEDGFQNIAFERDGGVIRGLYVDNGAQAVVVLVHPYRHDAKDFFIDSGHVKLYSELGLDIVLFDMNGFGLSDDIDSLLFLDVESVTNQIISMDKYDTIIVHGVSLGGAMAITGLDQTQVDAVIIENTMDDALSYLKVRKPMMYWTIKLISIVFPKSLHKIHYAEEVAKISHIPSIHLIYGNQDQLSTLAMGQRILTHAPSHAKMHCFEGGHLEIIKKDAKQYRLLLRNIVYSK